MRELAIDMDIKIEETELGIIVAIICIFLLAFVWLLLSKRRESSQGQVSQSFEKVQRSDVNDSSSDSLSDISDNNIQDDSDDEDEEVHHSSVYKPTAYSVEKPTENEPKVRKPVVTGHDQTRTDPPQKKVKQIEQLLKTSRCIVRGSPSIYKVRVKITKKVKEGIIEMAEVGTPHSLPSKPIRVFMVVGATGAGKSTLINGMVNYLLGVKFEDNFRFKIITEENEMHQSQAHSQTQKITAYTVYWHEGSPVNYDLIIIDTPGFGDTRGMKQDELIKGQIKDFFSMKEGIDQIHGVGFVIPSSLARLTPVQKYNFNSVLSVFGKDIEKSIFIMATFSDGDEPVVEGALNAADIPYCQLHKFNNEPLFETKAKAINKHNWKMAYDNFKNFFAHFSRKNAVSLHLTRDVLEERQKLETLVEGLHTQIKDGIVKIDALNQEEKVLRSHEVDILQNKDFTYTVTVTKHRKIDITEGWYVTNCQNCNFTCHRVCAYSNDQDKHRCSAMNGRGVANASCRVCPGHCHWKLHRNNPYYFETYEDEETRTSAELKEHFHTASTKKSGVEGMISKLERELEEMYNEVFLDIREVRKSLERLSKIALKPNLLSDADYISLLIQAEENEQNPGYIKRIAYLKQVQRQAEFMKNFEDDQVEKGAKEWWKKIGALQKIDDMI